MIEDQRMIRTIHKSQSSTRRMLYCLHSQRRLTFLWIKQFFVGCLPEFFRPLWMLTALRLDKLALVSVARILFAGMPAEWRDHHIEDWRRVASGNSHIHRRACRRCWFVCLCSPSATNSDKPNGTHTNCTPNMWCNANIPRHTFSRSAGGFCAI